MPSYLGKQTASSDQLSQAYLHINNCGFYEGLDQMQVRRPDGRKDYQLIYIKSGRMQFSDLILSSGHVYLYRPGEPQYYSICNCKTSFFWVHFTGSEVDSMLSFFQNTSYCVGEFSEFESFCRNYYMDRRLEEHFNEMLYEGRLICLLAHLADLVTGRQEKQAQYTKISKALLAMNSSISSRLTNEDLANLCGLSKHYFIKLFKSITSLSPQQYYTALVVEKAKDLLENTDYSVDSISSLCGVEDSFYFSRLFKKHVGRSPQQYRKQRASGF